MILTLTRRRLLATTAAAALTAAVPRAARATGAGDAIAFARTLYALDEYWASITSDETTIRRYCDPTLAGLVLDNISRDPEAESALSYDPLLQAQDWDNVRVSFSINTIAEKTATVNVVIENFGERAFVILDLALTDQGWRLADIRASGESLVEELTRLNAAS